MEGVEKKQARRARAEVAGLEKVGERLGLGASEARTSTAWASSEHLRESEHRCGGPCAVQRERGKARKRERERKANLSKLY